MGSQPKGSLCMACTDCGKDCSGKNFDSMKPIKIYPDGVKAVKCDDFKHAVSPRKVLSDTNAVASSSPLR